MPPASMSAGRQGSNSRRSSWNSAGGAEAIARRLVEPGAIGVEQRAEIGVELRLLAERHPAQAERAHQPVDRQPVAAGDLGDPAGR